MFDSTSLTVYIRTDFSQTFDLLYREYWLSFESGSNAGLNMCQTKFIIE